MAKPVVLIDGLPGGGVHKQGGTKVQNCFVQHKFFGSVLATLRQSELADRQINLSLCVLSETIAQLCYLSCYTQKGPSTSNCLLSTRVDNGGALVVLDSAALRASSLESHDNVHGLLVSNLTEDNVAAVEPRGDNGGDKELRAIANFMVSRKGSVTVAVPGNQLTC